MWSKLRHYLTTKITECRLCLLPKTSCIALFCAIALLFLVNSLRQWQSQFHTGPQNGKTSEHFLFLANLTCYLWSLHRSSWKCSILRFAWFLCEMASNCQHQQVQTPMSWQLRDIGILKNGNSVYSPPPKKTKNNSLSKSFALFLCTYRWLVFLQNSFIFSEKKKMNFCFSKSLFSAIALCHDSRRLLVN